MTIAKFTRSTISAGGWSAVGAATLQDAVDPVNDADQDIHASCSDGSTMDLAFEDADNPNELAGIQVGFYYASNENGVTVTGRASLLDVGSSTVVAFVDVEDVGDVDAPTIIGFNYITIDLTEAEAALITDFSNLALRVVDTSTPGTSALLIKSVSLTLPDRRMRAHVSG